jgi:hypothetical protein
MENLIRDVRILFKADRLIADVWFGVLLRRSGLRAAGAVIAAFALAMANLAGLLGLSHLVGMAWSASIIAVMDGALAAAAFLLASQSKPGSELELAQDVRRMALDALTVDSQELQTTIAAVRDDIRSAKLAVTGLVHRPIDLATEALLIPLVRSLVKSLTSASKTQESAANEASS